MRMTRPEFEDQFNRIDPSNTADRLKLIDRALAEGLITLQQWNQVWRGRIYSEAVPPRVNVVNIPITGVDGGTPPPSSVIPDRVRNPGNPLRPGVAPLRAAGKDEGFEPIGGDLLWRPHP